MAYIKPDGGGVISSVFIGAIPILSEKYIQLVGPKYELMSYWYTEDNVPTQKWNGSAVIPRTQEEIEADRANLPKPEPTQEERLTALEGKVEGMAKWEQAYKKGVQQA